MSERDEVAIAEAILESIRSDEPMAPWVADWGSLDSQPIDGNVNLIRAARAILARWRIVPNSVLGPGLDGAVREYFEHGFNDQVILAAFPQLTAQQLATLRSTDRHGRTHPDYHGD